MTDTTTTDARDQVLDVLGSVGLDILELDHGYRKIRARHLPGTVEYEQASGALVVLELLADRCATLLTGRGRNVMLFPARPKVEKRRLFVVGCDPGDETEGGAA
jgi:hypothetical protein